VAGLVHARPDRGGPGRLRAGTARAGSAGSARVQPRGDRLPRPARRLAPDPQPLVDGPPDQAGRIVKVQHSPSSSVTPSWFVITARSWQTGLSGLSASTSTSAVTVSPR